jgi:hypothetical protein
MHDREKKSFIMTFSRPKPARICAPIAAQSAQITRFLGRISIRQVPRACDWFAKSSGAKDQPVHGIALRKLYSMWRLFWSRPTRWEV